MVVSQESRRGAGGRLDIPEVRGLLDALDWHPTAPQAEILECAQRMVLVAGGDQSGKSMVAAAFLVLRNLMEHEDPPYLYWLVAADYERTRREFEYLGMHFGRLGLLAKGVPKKINPGQLELTDGTVIKTKSAQDPRTIAMEAPNGILGCEASQLDYNTYERLRFRIAPKKGWLLMSGSFESSLGWYPQLWEAWQVPTPEARAFSIPTPSNTHLFPGGMEDPEIVRLRNDSSDAFFAERIMARPTPPKGTVFGNDFNVTVHVPDDVEYIPGEAVYVWMDPGYAGAYALEAAHIVDGQVRVFDEVYERELTTEQMVQVAMSREWWQDVRFGAIDVAGYQHQAMAAPAEIWLKETGLYLAAEKVRIADGIERLRGFLKPDPITKRPNIVFSGKCVGILSEFGAVANPFTNATQVYSWQTDRSGNIVGQTPRDEFNHGIKAVTYGIIAKFGYGYVRDDRTFRVTRW